MFAQGCSADVVDSKEFDYDRTHAPIVLRGILKYKIMKRCWQDNRPFYYMDTGYFGNNPGPNNPQGWKLYHRVVKNNLQHHDLTARPDDRWRRLGIKIQPWRRSGRKIVLAAPDEKPCKFYGIDQQEWINSTLRKLKQHTDRDIEVRQRPAQRQERISSNTLLDSLKDAHALVTYNSNAATEAVLNGVPAFVLAPCHAAAPVASSDLSQIERPNYADSDLVYRWACHLAYGQFHVKELRDGSARIILEETA